MFCLSKKKNDTRIGHFHDGVHLLRLPESFSFSVLLQISRGGFRAEEPAAPLFSCIFKKFFNNVKPNVWSKMLPEWCKTVSSVSSAPSFWIFWIRPWLGTLLPINLTGITKFKKGKTKTSLVVVVACRTGVIFCVFQASQGKCEASTKCKTRTTGGTQKNNACTPTIVHAIPAVISCHISMACYSTTKMAITSSCSIDEAIQEFLCLFLCWHSRRSGQHLSSSPVVALYEAVSRHFYQIL